MRGEGERRREGGEGKREREREGVGGERERERERLCTLQLQQAPRLLQSIEPGELYNYEVHSGNILVTAGNTSKKKLSLFLQQEGHQCFSM